jgi:hypothetical protein
VPGLHRPCVPYAQPVRERYLRELVDRRGVADGLTGGTRRKGSGLSLTLGLLFEPGHVGQAPVAGLHQHQPGAAEKSQHRGEDEPDEHDEVLITRRTTTGSKDGGARPPKSLVEETALEIVAPIEVLSLCVVEREPLVA